MHRYTFGHYNVTFKSDSQKDEMKVVRFLHTRSYRDILGFMHHDSTVGQFPIGNNPLRYPTPEAIKKFFGGMDRLYMLLLNDNNNIWFFHKPDHVYLWHSGEFVEVSATIIDHKNE